MTLWRLYRDPSGEDHPIRFSMAYFELPMTPVLAFGIQAAINTRRFVVLVEEVRAESAVLRGGCDRA